MRFVTLNFIFVLSKIYNFIDVQSQLKNIMIDRLVRDLGFKNISDNFIYLEG